MIEAAVLPNYHECLPSGHRNILVLSAECPNIILLERAQWNYSCGAVSHS